MIRLERVCARYDAFGPTVLHDVTLAMPQGGFRWLVGPSGSGKSTLLRVIALGLPASAGWLTLLDTPIHRTARRALPRLRRRVGTLLAEPGLLPTLSVFDNVALPLRLARRRDGLVRAEVGEMLRWVGLGAQAEVAAARLCTGERQRVALARAVVIRPALVLADEPTALLDPRQGDRTLQLLAEMAEAGTTVLVATRDASLPARHGGAVIAIQAGSVSEAARGALP